MREVAIAVGSTLAVVVIAALVMTNIVSQKIEVTDEQQVPQKAISDLEEFGNALAASTGGVVKYVSIEQTMKSPMNAFKLIFTTDSQSLISAPNASPGNAAYLENIGKTKLWSVKFCTEKLKSIMSQYGIDSVFGDLTNSHGETQSMAIC